MKKLIHFCLFTLFVVAAFSQVTKTINLTTAGTLSSLLTANEKTTVTDLTLTGSIDARDVKCMRDEMTKLAVIDISTVKIESYEGYGGTKAGSNGYYENYLPENSFGDWDRGKTSLTNIKLPTSLTSIGDDAFNNCIGLTSIIIPLNVTYFSNYVFYGCSGLTTINIPASVSSIENNIFYGCTNLSSITVDPTNTEYSSLAGVMFDKSQTALIRYPEGKKGGYTIPSTVKEIQRNAFNGCAGLSGSLTIPISLLSIDEIDQFPFYGCTGLAAFEVDVLNPFFSSKDGVLFNKTQTEILAFPAGKTGSYVVPSTVTNFVNVSDISGLSALTIPGTISGNCVFEINVGGNLNLRYLEAPAKYFEESPWDDDAILFPPLDTVKINSGNLTAYGSAFLRLFQTIKKLDLSQTTNTTLPKSALLDLGELEELILPAGLTSLSYKSVAECASLKSINIPASVTEIGMRAFENCRSMKNVIFAPNSELKIIDKWAFYACHGLQDITIPNGVTTVGDGAFWGCEYLSDLTLPSSVQKINDNGFDGCIGLSKIKVEATIPPVVSAKTFNRVNKNASLYVPDASLTMYKNAFGWKDFFNIKGISTQVQELEELSYGIRIIDRNIEITNAKGSKINVYDISGRVLFTKTAAQDSENIQLSNKGIYLLSIDGFNRKIIVD